MVPLEEQHGRRMTGMVWSRPISQLHPGSKAVAKESLPGVGILSHTEGGSWYWCLAPKQSQAGQELMARLKDAGASVSGVVSL